MLTAGADSTQTGGATTTAEGEGAAAGTQQPGTTEGGKPAGEGAGTAAEGKPAGSETAAQGAPETYTDFKLPEGVALGELDVEVKGLAKELGLSQENAQKVVDTAAKLTQQHVAQQTAVVADIHAQWIEAAKSDKEFGGEKLTENLAIAKAAMLATTTPELQVLLDKSGLGNNPEVIRHFLKIAPAFAPDKFVPGGKSPTGGDKPAEKVLYPNNA